MHRSAQLLVFSMLAPVIDALVLGTALADIFEVSHIPFAARPDKPEGREKARLAAQSTPQELRADTGGFERLAKERSADPESQEQGCHLG